VVPAGSGLCVLPPQAACGPPSVRGGAAQAVSVPTRAPRAASALTRVESRQQCPKPTLCCRDRVASYSATTQYDQLMGGAYDDSHVFERGGEIEPAAAGARDAPAVAIAVKDPVRKVEASMLPGINGGYVTYRVDTRTALPGFARPEASVRRRFREFVVRRRRGPTT